MKSKQLFIKSSLLLVEYLGQQTLQQNVTNKLPNTFLSIRNTVSTIPSLYSTNI